MPILEPLDFALDLASVALLASGGFFIIIGSLGLVRFPDFYCRVHAAGVTDTLGAWLVILGLVLQSPSMLVATKLLIIALFVFFTSPTATHAIANAAFTAGEKPWLKPGKKDTALTGPR
jgi:multicomponent Na+:H+ antiporter subunit G